MFYLMRAHRRVRSRAQATICVGVPVAHLVPIAHLVLLANELIAHQFWMVQFMLRAAVCRGNVKAQAAKSFC